MMDEELEEKKETLRYILAQEEYLRNELIELKTELTESKYELERLKLCKEKLPIAIAALTRLATLHGTEEH